MLAFPKKNKNLNKEKTLVFNDRVFNKGIIKFTLKEVENIYHDIPIETFGENNIIFIGITITTNKRK